MNNFPGRTKRTKVIEEIFSPNYSGGQEILCGRVIGLLDGEVLSSGLMAGLVGEAVGERGFILKDESGKIVILADVLPPIGAIIEIEVNNIVGGKASLVGEFVVLAECEDFYISLKQSPNYKKMVIDERFLNRLKMRAQMIASIREFFEKKAFIETDTPCLVKLPGMEPYLDIFKTKFEAELGVDQKLNEEMYLITSPEYAMKKLLVGGLEKIFQITRAFRNKETFSERHNPEFVILEWYRAYASYLEIMDDTEQLVQFLWSRFGEKDGAGQSVKLIYKGKEIDVMAKWRRLKVVQAFEEYAGIKPEILNNLEELRKAVSTKGYKVDENTGFDDLFFVVFMNEIEPRLGFDVPVILCDYPVSMAALSKRCLDDPRYAERFEVYIGGLELCNAFTELNDPLEQARRLSEEREERIKMGKDKYDVDQTFVDALKFGMPPSGGNALGVDRLIMLILNEPDIRNVLFFPHRDL